MPVKSTSPAIDDKKQNIPVYSNMRLDPLCGLVTGNAKCSSRERYKSTFRHCNLISIYCLPQQDNSTTNNNDSFRQRSHNYSQKAVPIPRNLEKSTTNLEGSEQYPVPKFLFLNICGLNKVKDKVRAPVALEADMHAADIDVCIVSETHLKPEIPDSVVAISNYAICRRDRNSFGNDKRKGGGIAIYTRKNIFVEKVCRSDKFECI